MNSFKTTSLAVGDTTTLVINDVKDGKFGPMYIGTVDGVESYIQPSGNLKYMVEKLEKGELTLGKAFTITRSADAKTKAGFSVTQFAINAKDGSTTKAAAVSNVSDKLAAIRAKRAQPTNNS